MRKTVRFWPTRYNHSANAHIEATTENADRGNSHRFELSPIPIFDYLLSPV